MALAVLGALEACSGFAEVPEPAKVSPSSMTEKARPHRAQRMASSVFSLRQNGQITGVPPRHKSVVIIRQEATARKKKRMAKLQLSN